MIKWGFPHFIFFYHFGWYAIIMTYEKGRLH